MAASRPLRVSFAPVTGPALIAAVAVLLAPMLLLGASAGAFPAGIPPAWLFAVAIAGPVLAVLPVVSWVMRRTARGRLEEVPGGFLVNLDGVAWAFDAGQPIEVELGRGGTVQIGEADRVWVWARFSQGDRALALGYYAPADRPPDVPVRECPGPSYELTGFHTVRAWNEVVTRLGGAG